MLKIIPMTKPEEQEKICLICGLKYDRTQFAYGAYEDDEIVGAAQFIVKDGVGYVTDLKCAREPNYPLIMLLGRAVWGSAMTVILGIGGGAFTFSAFASGAFVNAIPGIVLQLILIPFIMLILDKTKTVRFSKNNK